MSKKQFGRFTPLSIEYLCFLLGIVDSPQWNPDICLTNAVDQLIPNNLLLSSDCDGGISPVRYTQVQLNIDPLNGRVMITDLAQHLGNPRREITGDLIVYSNRDPRQKV